MAPLIHDAEVSVSSHDIYDQKTIIAPLHETSIHEQRKHVSFDDMDTVYEIPNLKYFTCKEKKACWFTLQDMNQMKEQLRKDAKIIDFGILIQGTCVSNRGLECKTRAGAIRKRQLRINAYAAVFKEIEFQRREGIIDDEMLADTYYISSLQSAREAYLIARQDEAEAKAMQDSQLNDSESFLQFNPSLPDISHHIRSHHNRSHHTNP